jgi:exopolysaccharide biosynthesis polyprenyl glycosylphosphotransferase
MVLLLYRKPLPAGFLKGENASVMHPISIEVSMNNVVNYLFKKFLRNNHAIKDLNRKKDSTVVYSSVDERFCRDLEIVAQKHYNYFRSVEKSDPFKISTRYLTAKRCFDIFATIIGLILLSPLFPVVVILIKLDSRGPVFFSQERVGKKGRIFRIHKFRTMVQDAERKTGPVWAKKDDPRFTVVGRVLRKTKIDELPQLFNVIKGDMSLVGPRPERPCFVERFAEIMPGYNRRHDVIPGITGLAQLRNGYDSTPKHLYRKLRYDVTYIKKMGMAIDFRILAETFLAVLLVKA